MALTSNTGTVDSSELTFQNIAIGHSKGDGIIAYLDYTKGAGDSDIVITPSFNDSRLDEEFYKQIYIDDSGALNVFTITMSTSGKYRMPISVAMNEDYLKLSVSGLVDGDLNIDFVIDNPYF